MFNASRVNSELPLKERVIVIAIGGEAKACGFSDLGKAARPVMDTRNRLYGPL